MSGGYSRLHVRLYVSVERRDTDNYFKKIISNFNFGFNKSALQFFNPMVVLYQKIAERVFYYVDFLKYGQLFRIPYFLSFPRKIGSLKKI